MEEKCMCATSEPDPRDGRLREIIAEHAGTSGSLIPVLHEAQELAGRQERPVARDGAAAGAPRRPFPAAAYGSLTAGYDFRAGQPDRGGLSQAERFGAGWIDCADVTGCVSTGT